MSCYLGVVSQRYSQLPLLDEDKALEDKNSHSPKVSMMIPPHLSTSILVTLSDPLPDSQNSSLHQIKTMRKTSLRRRTYLRLFVVVGVEEFPRSFKKR